MADFQDCDSPTHSLAVDAPATAVETQTVGIYLEEVGYFLEDMKKDIWWLLRAAHQPSGEVFYRGNEELAEVAPDKEAIISGLTDRYKLHVEAHENQVRAKVAIIPAVTPDEMEVLHALRRLKFHCRGKVEVFPCMKEANNAAIWGAYHNYVSSSNPQWMVLSDGAGQKLVFGQFVSVVPLFVNPAKKEIKLLHVFCPDRKKRHWAFPGGDIIRGVDNSLYDAARREFDDELGVFFGRSWKECFEKELPLEADKDIEDDCNVNLVSLEKDGVRYPCRSYFFAKVTEEFYDSSRSYEDAQGVLKLPTSGGKFVHWDDMEKPDMAAKVHVDGFIFAEHDEARWLNLDFETGRLWSEDNRPIRKENVEMFKSQPDKIWEYLAKLVGCPVPEKKAFELPADFNPDGPFAVRVSGIDKQATEENIKDFFEAGGVLKTTLVKQLEVPRHTARVEFEDIKMLETALTLSGRQLERRKVKVEIWTEVAEDEKASGDTYVPGARPLVAFDGTLPEEGPFKAMCRSLDRSVTRDDLGYFFWDRSCQVKDVEYPVKGERHAGLVEFENQESLRKALSLNNAIFKQREMIIELPGASPPGGGLGGGAPRRDRDDRRDKGGGKGGGKGKRDRDDRGGFSRDDRGGFRDDRAPPSREEFGSSRPKLALKPRSVPVDQSGYGDRPSPSHSGQEPERRSRPDPFGGARPVNDRFASTRADADDNWRR